MRKYGITFDDHGSNDENDEYHPLSPEKREAKSSNGLPLVRTLKFPTAFALNSVINRSTIGRTGLTKLT